MATTTLVCGAATLALAAGLPFDGIVGTANRLSLVASTPIGSLTAAQVQTMLSVPNIHALMAAYDFPKAVSDDGAGNIVFDMAAVAAFVTIMATAKSNGYTVLPVHDADAPWATLAAGPGPPSGIPACSVSGLFDGD